MIITKTIARVGTGLENSDIEVIHYRQHDMVHLTHDHADDTGADRIGIRPVHLPALIEALQAIVDLTDAQNADEVHRA